MSDSDEATDGLTSEQVLALILPKHLARGYGGHLVDSEDHHYIDMVSAWGANLLGYDYQRVSRAISDQATKYTNLGLATPEYHELEALLKRHVPCCEVIHLLKNGSDATAAAIRVARHATGRGKILHRGYHGAQDWCMASVSCPGVPDEQRSQIITLDLLEPEKVQAAFAAHPGEISCLIFDPLNWPIPDRKAMLEIRDIVHKNGALLIFDEVVSGFRAAVGGMQEVWEIKPDLACLGKGIANGMPLSVLVGQYEAMKDVQTINYSLTYRLESLSIIAAIETINEVVEKKVCEDLAAKGRVLKKAYARLCKTHGVDSALVGHDTRPQLHFFDEKGLQSGTCNYMVIKELALNRICTYGTFSLCYSHDMKDIESVIKVFDAALEKVSLKLHGKNGPGQPVSHVPQENQSTKNDLAPKPLPSRKTLNETAPNKAVPTKAIEAASTFVSTPAMPPFTPLPNYGPQDELAPYQIMQLVDKPVIVKSMERSLSSGADAIEEPREPVLLDAELEARLDPEKIYYMLPGELAEIVDQCSTRALKARFGNDKWLSNYLINIKERLDGECRLTTYPWHVTLSIMSTCNAKCEFCNIPLRKSRNPGLEMDLDSVPHLAEVLSHARIFLMTGGEPTTHPRFSKMLRQLKDILDPRAYASMITHGARLHRFKDEFSEVNMNLSVSLNAATPETHHSLMKLGPDAFSQIVDSIRWARSIGRTVEISMVVVRQNLVEIPDFLRLADELGVHAVYLRSLIAGDHYFARFPNEKDFESYPAWTHPDVELWQDRARKAINEVNVKVYGDPAQWSVPLHSAKLPEGTDRTEMMTKLRKPLPVVKTRGLPVVNMEGDWRGHAENPYDRQAPFACDYPWHAIKLLDQTLRIDPCGFLQNVQGHEDIGLYGSSDFFKLWNSPAMVYLRETLHKGPLLPECLTCPYQLNGTWQARAKGTRGKEKNSNQAA